MDRRSFIALSAATLAAPELAHAAEAPLKVFRYAFPTAESGFDPAQITDLYSRTLTPHIFEALYCYDHLARPLKIKPLVAAGMPEHSEDFRVWTVKVRPGIFFADDPAFKGKPREVVAQDFIYALKRFADPALKSPGWSSIEQVQYLGLAEARQRAIDGKKPFDYDANIEGLRALDRYTLQFKLAEPDPRFVYNQLSASDLYGAVAREVVEHYGAQIAEHPVGTGPFVLKQWRRSSFIALERNPNYRVRTFDGEPAPDDVEGQAILAKLKGKRIPIVDRVEVSIIEEEQPYWLSFLNGTQDFCERVPAAFIETAAPNGKLAPNLAKRGIQLYRTLASDTTMSYFNMEDPVVGGYTPEKVALRRAMGLAVDLDREIRSARRGQAIPAQSMVSPNLFGYDDTYRSVNSEFNLGKARALLDMYGYVDRDGDGWRELPDGAPLEIIMSTQPDQRSRQLNEVWKKGWDAIGIKVTYRPAKWPENMKSARAGKLQMWSVGSLADVPDGQTTLSRVYGPQKGQQNLARFQNAELDELYKKMLTMPDSPQRLEMFDRIKRIVNAYMPYKYHAHRIFTDMAQPWLIGYRRPLFWQEFWHMLDIDESKRPR
ncbi:ABC transporter substrate-binding protein [Piscinibacter terrae]|uniref:Bicyclomycin resistance protein n=1 Tax=Piscinibacter terrae TaxID=2496871 RepID=A0A3N7K087_9BURK|nr:ABC transporter substrate-binding protein [Albitalea terrae]RQP24435.1 bicyclomycin resistance protein [Albitalea terrae]